MNAWTLHLPSSATSSRIEVGRPLAQWPSALRQLIPAGTQVGIVADAAVKHHGRHLVAGLRRRGVRSILLIVPPGERSKTLERAGQLYAELARAGFDRSSWLVALGGGVVNDMTGFVAATFMRGIPVVQAPTTLLAQVDASIGGKTGVDLREGKNLVGSFYHPRRVWIDPALLRTLPPRHLHNGLAEVIKYGAIADARLFATLENSLDRLLKGISAEWTPIIARCAQIKSQVVARDPEERTGLRATLNFGHTVGHAIEAACGYAGYLHGEAISIGMIVAGTMSRQLGLLPPVESLRLAALLRRAGLPDRARRPIARRRLKSFLYRDKKNDRGALRFVLLKGLGKAVSGQSVPSDVLDEALRGCGL